MIRIKKGLDIPIIGRPDSRIEAARSVNSVALLGDDYVGMKPTMEVREGDSVKLGQCVYTDKKNPLVKHTAPGSGVIRSIVRGDKRKFESLVIDLKGSEAVSFASYGAGKLYSLERAKVQENLLESGLWTAIRTRPYSKTPDPEKIPEAIFVAVMDTNPLAGNPEEVLAESMDEFVHGLEVLTRLTEGKIHVCHGPESKLPLQRLKFVSTHGFGGKHPAGNVGTHIHHLHPVHRDSNVWHVGYQDVVAIGRLFLTGRLETDRIVALGGPHVERPRLVRTRLGANLEEMVQGELKSEHHRIVSGSILNGHWAKSPHQFLGRFHNQVSVLREGDDREFLGWQKPGFNKYSVTGLFASKLLVGKQFAFSSSAEGSPRAMVPIGTYEKVMPLDILPTQLLRALIVKDTETAKSLGCMELDEEDLALCTFVCPGKYNYGPILRDNLAMIERDG